MSERCIGPRRFFPDEEPESDHPWFSSDSYSGMCAFCGHADHDAERCPHRPAHPL